MIDLDTARERVKEYLLRMERLINASGCALPGYQDPQHRFVIVEECEYDFGWVFGYNTKKYIETGDASYTFPGNAPLIVDRANGELCATGSAYPLEHFISEYRKGVRRKAELVKPARSIGKTIPKRFFRTLSCIED